MKKNNNTNLNESKQESIEDLMLQLEDVETKIASGELKISEQIKLLNAAKELSLKIKILLDTIKAEVNIIKVSK